MQGSSLDWHSEEEMTNYPVKGMDDVCGYENTSYEASKLGNVPAH